MNNQNADKRNYDVASISRPGKQKRANYVQNALHIDSKKLQTSGRFIKVFSDIFLKHEINNKSFF
jgi:hypothetical protein